MRYCVHPKSVNLGYMTPRRITDLRSLIVGILDSRLTSYFWSGLSRCLLRLLLCVCPPIYAQGQNEASNDQLLVLFGSSGYVLYKVLDFANDHGFRYIKILSYEFQAFGHSIKGVWSGADTREGRYFELKDENVWISFLCFKTPPEDIYVVDLEKYRSVLERIAAE